MSIKEAGDVFRNWKSKLPLGPIYLLLWYSEVLPHQAVIAKSGVQLRKLWASILVTEPFARPIQLYIGEIVDLSPFLRAEWARQAERGALKNELSLIISELEQAAYGEEDPPIPAGVLRCPCPPKQADYPEYHALECACLGSRYVPVDMTWEEFYALTAHDLKRLG